MADQRKCGTCGGTGRIWCARSWFPADGYRGERCVICDGSGFSDYRPDAAYAAFQAKARAAVQERRHA